MSIGPDAESSVRGHDQKDLDVLIVSLRALFNLEKAVEKARQDDALATWDKKVNGALNAYDQQLEACRKSIADRLTNLLRFPPYHIRHMRYLDQFFSDGTYEKNVFVMAKFPEGKGVAAKKLQGVIDVVCEEIAARGYHPRIASQRDYHASLWDNVELYLLGCSQGVALLEDRYRPELNPNVAMEWGWMRSMGKSVLSLVEARFKHARADWSGLLENRFTWEHPRDGIRPAIMKWLAGP